MKIRLVGGVMLTAISVVLFGSCVSDKDSSGLEYMPDMYRSPAIEPYVDYGEVRGRENIGMKMQQSALTPPYGAIPYYGTDAEYVSLMLPWSILPNAEFASTHGLKGFAFAKTDQDTYGNDAAAWNWNPLKMEIEATQNGDKIDRKNLTLANSKKLYTANCMHCHGSKGDGNGPMMESGAYSGVPNYADKKDLSDGQLFYSIYYGKGMMGSHAPQLNKKEIWSLVHYVRKFQDADYDKDLMESTMPAGVKLETAPVEQMDWDRVNLEEIKGHHMGLKILYASNSAEIDMAKSTIDLNHILKFMQDNPEVKIELAGHTDSSGDDTKNQTMSEKRSQAVKSWLVENGIAAGRIRATGYGETQLLMSEDGHEDAEASRRTELIIK